MLDVGRIRGRTCRQPSRRAFLQAGSLGALGLTLGDLFALRQTRALTRPDTGSARAVIMLWLWGGPSHLETFDPKPDAPLEYRGPYQAIATRVPGFQIGELLPGLAQRADKLSVVRSMHHQSNDHGVAGTIALTGSIGGALDLGGQAAKGVLQPSTGAIVGRLAREGRWSTPAHPRPLPAYTILGNLLHQGHKRVVGEGGGLLGSAYDPFRLDYEPGVGLKVPDLNLPDDLPAQRLATRWGLLEQLQPGHTESNLRPASPLAAMNNHYSLARSLITSRDSLEALEPDHEPTPVQEAYGAYRFGRCCLVARRLVEAGLPFVQVNWSTHVEGPEDAGDGGWDMHDNYFSIMQDRHGWMFDRSVSALLDDLDSRGLLATTLVVAVGEFGRTPKINDKAGRDHWNPCYSAMLAGGGVQGGRVIGSSDKRGEYPVDRPTTPADLGATILAALGVTAADITSLGLTPAGQPIDELFRG